MIRWTFFFEEGSVISEVKDEKEDERCLNFLRDFSHSWLDIPGTNADLHINLMRVKLISRETVPDSQSILPPIPDKSQNVQTDAA